MATKAQIDAAAAILAEALDLQGSRFNGRIVPDWDALKRSFSGGLAQFEALGLDTTDARAAERAASRPHRRRRCAACVEQRDRRDGAERSASCNARQVPEPARSSL